MGTSPVTPEPWVVWGLEKIDIVFRQAVGRDNQRYLALTKHCVAKDPAHCPLESIATVLCHEDAPESSPPSRSGENLASFLEIESDDLPCVQTCS